MFNNNYNLNVIQIKGTNHKETENIQVLRVVKNDIVIDTLNNIYNYYEFEILSDYEMFHSDTTILKDLLFFAPYSLPLLSILTFSINDTF